jgi:hypothetical protein
MFFALLSMALSVSCSSARNTVYYQNVENHSIVEIDLNQHVFYYCLSGGDTKSKLCALDMISLDDTTYLLKIRHDTTKVNLIQDTLNDGMSIRKYSLPCFIKEDTLILSKKSKEITVQMLDGSRSFKKVK